MPGDVVRVKHDAAPWSQAAAGEDLFQAFEVLEVTENRDETRDFLLRVYNAATYPDTAGPSQNLVDTTVLRRPPPPPSPEDWHLTANLAGELRLAVAIPRNADYRTGDLTLLADEELERVTTTLAAPVTDTDQQITVNSSDGFMVGDSIAIGEEILVISGPGVRAAPPTSNTWDVGRAQGGRDTTRHLSTVNPTINMVLFGGTPQQQFYQGSTAAAHSGGDVVYRLTERVLQ